jgi:hypothetical protein
MNKLYKYIACSTALILGLTGCAPGNTEAVSEEVPTQTETPAEDTTEETSFDPVDWKASHPKVRGLYITGPTAGSERMNEIIQLIDDTELNAVVIDVKDDNGNITFSMEGNDAVTALDACVPYITDMPELMKTLKEHDIYTIARIPCFKDPTLAAGKPELALCKPDGSPIVDGKGVAWVNPCKKEVWEYLVGIATSCKEVGFDEVQFDYVRFPVGEDAEAADYGEEVTPENKHTYIEGFLSYASKELHAIDMPVTADLFGTVIGNPIDIEQVGQDYAALSTTADVLCPMIYPSHYGPGNFNLAVPDAAPYETILAALEGSKKELSSVKEEDCAVIRPWLQAFSAPWVQGHISYGGDEIRAQIQAVYDAGYEEWILWNAKCNYTSDGLEAAP